MLQTKIREDFSNNHEVFSWDTPDGKKLYAQLWSAGKKTRATILLVHDLGEHSSRYTRWAAQLVNEGISVLSFDFRGHGQTSGKPGKIWDYTKLLDDIDILVTQGKKLFQNTPLFLYGHSMGGNLVANYAITKAIDLNGIILTSPWFELSNLPPRFKLSSALFLSKLMPWVLANSKLRPEYVSRELREVHLYKNDNLVHDKISLGLFRKAYEQGQIAKRSIYKINSPLLVMHGSDDQITSCQATREFIRNASERTQYVEFEGGYHELHNDLDREKVFTQLLDWINGQLKSDA